MAITLKESRAVADIADLLYTFLPGSGHPSWTGHVSFKSISAKVQLEQFWQGGSKLPMIIGLLERTLEHRRNLFQKLILEVVREGIKYRQKKGEPVIIKEIELLNGLLIDVGFKFPELWDSAFLDSLKDGGIRAKENLDRIIQEKKIEIQESRNLSKELRRLKEEFFILQEESNRNKAGIDLQGILKQLFALSGLEPRKPFRVVGEEIDGSFELDHEIYLLEAMWEKNPIPQRHLMEFREKIEGKSKFTRGLFISISGYSEQAKKAIVKGKIPVFFCLDGFDLCMILSEDISLQNFLRTRLRLLTEEGDVFSMYQKVAQYRERNLTSSLH